MGVTAMRRVTALFALLVGGTMLASALAQESPSYTLNEHTFNAGGNPMSTPALTSTSFRLTLSAVGDGVTPADIASAGFNISGGFVSTYRPPGEVTNLLFTDATTLVWDSERSVGVYNLYEGKIVTPGDGACSTGETLDIAVPTASVSATPALGEAIRLVATAENRLAEEGTMGTDSDGDERSNPSPCP